MKCLLLFLFGLCLGQEDGPLVETNYGTLRGSSLVYRDGRAYEQYMGVPFASAPLGEKRWMRADPPVPWDGVREATEYGAHCTSLLAQFYGLVGWSSNVSEDCLFLNVVVPGSVESVETPLPVIVYFTGGAWLIGTAEYYPGMKLALDGQVIVVTINYRLGVLGFLSTEDENAPGNAALWDDIAALQWVKENIQYFGGDPDLITILGQSAGGATVSHIANSPEAQGLFERVIALSGSSTALWAWTNRGLGSARDLALANLCPILNTENMVNCLRELEAGRLDVMGLITPIIFDSLTPITAWAPVIDGVVIPQDPRISVQEGANARYDLLTGYAHDDGAGVVYINPLGIPGLENLLNLASTPELLNSTLMLAFSYYGNPEQLLSEIKLQYPDLDNTDLDIRTRALSQVVTDFAFASPSDFAAEHHSMLSTERSTYAYEFSYRQSFLGYADWVNGSHVDDLYSVFGEPFLEPIREAVIRKNFSDTDQEVGLNVIHYYSNFAYTGNPNTGPHSVPEQWPEYDATNRRYLVFGPNQEVAEQDQDLLDRFYWWNYIFPELTVPGNSINNRAPSRLTYALDLLNKVQDNYSVFVHGKVLGEKISEEYERIASQLQL